jgi:hypothetical protein
MIRLVMHSIYRKRIFPNRLFFSSHLRRFFGWTSGKLPIDDKETPRKVTVSEEEANNYQDMINMLVQAGN